MKTNNVDPAEDEVDLNHLPVFYQTISEQLNSRLSESPKFFWVVIAAGAGYGYAISEKSANPFIVSTASLIAYIVSIWALWYAVALGYGFRYLQFSQRRVERKLGWNVFVPPNTGEPPPTTRTLADLIWVLPSIYHPHFVGLSFLSWFAAGSFWYMLSSRSCCWPGYVAIVAIVLHVAIAWILCVHYLNKYRLIYQRSLDREKKSLSD